MPVSFFFFPQRLMVGTGEVGPSSQLVSNQEGNWSIPGPAAYIRAESNKLCKLQTDCQRWQTVTESLHPGGLIPASKAVWR